MENNQKNKKEKLQKWKSFNPDKIDYAHKLIYNEILNDSKLKRELRIKGVELDIELIHSICEHNKATIANWIIEKVQVIKVPYLGKILIKTHRETFENRVSIPLKQGLITKDEARVITQTIIKEIVAERMRIAKLNGTKYGKPKGKKPERPTLKITFIKPKEELPIEE